MNKATNKKRKLLAYIGTLLIIVGLIFKVVTKSEYPFIPTFLINIGIICNITVPYIRMREVMENRMIYNKVPIIGHWAFVAGCAVSIGSYFLAENTIALLFSSITQLVLLTIGSICVTVNLKKNASDYVCDTLRFKRDCFYKRCSECPLSSKLSEMEQLAVEVKKNSLIKSCYYPQMEEFSIDTEYLDELVYVNTLSEENVQDFEKQIDIKYNKIAKNEK